MATIDRMTELAIGTKTPTFFLPNDRSPGRRFMPKALAAAPVSPRRRHGPVDGRTLTVSGDPTGHGQVGLAAAVRVQHGGEHLATLHDARPRAHHVRIGVNGPYLGTRR